MGSTILICACGQKVKASGARPGRVGRCPSCGSRLEVPPALATPRAGSNARGGLATNLGSQALEDDSAGAGVPDKVPLGPLPRARRAKGTDTGDTETSFVGPRMASGPPLQTLGTDRTPLAGGLLRPLGSPESGLIGSLLYPLRGAEAVAIAVVMGSIFWGFTILLPEYCLAIWADANSLGTPSMGMLVVLISAIPALLLLPLFVIYLLQYLGRVLVSNARGDLVPPRMPDRNFDGIFHGLSPWLIWLVLGVSVGLLPFALLISLGDRSLSDRPIAAVSLLILGAAYAARGFDALVPPRSAAGLRPARCPVGALASWRHTAASTSEGIGPPGTGSRELSASAELTRQPLLDLSDLCPGLVGSVGLARDRGHAPPRRALRPQPGHAEMAQQRSALGHQVEALNRDGSGSRTDGLLRLEDLPCQRDANLADLAIGRLTSTNLVGVKFPLAVEVLPGFFEVDFGNGLPGCGPEGVGHLVEGDGFLGDAGGQVRVAAASSQS